MALVLLDNVSTCLALAFSSLDRIYETVNKSKLKVLTANLGTLLDMYGVEKGLDQFKETQYLNFQEYLEYLRQEVFSSLPDNTSLAMLQSCEGKIAEVCWLLSRKEYLLPEYKFNDSSVYELYRIFCTLAELSLDDENRSQALLSTAEAEIIAQKLSALLGNSWEDEDSKNWSMSMDNFSLGTFIQNLEAHCIRQIKDKQAIVEAVHELYQTYVEDVLKKGTLNKRGYIFPKMKEYWFVLKPCELSYFKTATEKYKCGSINLQPGNRIEQKSDAKLLLHTPEGSFELGAQDHMSQLQWHMAIQNAIEYSGGKQSYQRQQALKRQKQRQSRAQETQTVKEQLQLEKSARQLAEGKAKELKEVVEEESRKLQEMELVQKHLEELLVEETQARKDEEIVRGLQSRLLVEEWDKRAELEALQAEQANLIDEENKKMRKYQELDHQKEIQLQDAHAQLSRLQKERQELDEELKKAEIKISCSEQRKEYLELYLREVENGDVSAEQKKRQKNRRAHSYHFQH